MIINLFFFSDIQGSFKSISDGTGPAKGGFKPISKSGGFTAIPPPPPPEIKAPPPPLPRDNPPLPKEPPPPLPPGKEPKHFKMKFGGFSSAVKPSTTQNSIKHQPTSFGISKKTTGISMSFGVKKSTISFGAGKPTLAKPSASVFNESDSEEEDNSKEEETYVNRDLQENESLPSKEQQNELLGKVIEYAETLRIHERLNPKMLIRFVKGNESGILPGTIPQSSETSMTTNSKEKYERKEYRK